jgi:hypothetical protein
MTYLKRYSLRAVKGQKDLHGLTLYEAEKALQQAQGEGRLLDASGVYRSDMGHMRFVAFYCEWRGCVYPAFEANEMERRCIMA